VIYVLTATRAEAETLAIHLELGTHWKFVENGEVLRNAGRSPVVVAGDHWMKRDDSLEIQGVLSVVRAHVWHR
jgi:hypothetical protein